MKKLSPIMLAGTGSDVGKSLIATGLCRIFKQDGFRPAPFKAQNMALNSYATPDGLEIGRAQATQAEAAGIACSSDMNPLLLKPSGEMTSQVILNGRPLGCLQARDYYRDPERREWLRSEVCKAFDRLSAVYNPIVMEGAGSISELNLRDHDIVNLPMAQYAGAKVILVADIDRGGVFASVYGSVMLQNEADRKIIRGIIVNKFRGDLSLFDSGRKLLEEVCGVPVIGVVPYSTEFHIDEEDSVAIARKKSGASAGTDKVKIAVALIRHISNYTDFNALERRADTELYYARTAEDIAAADIIILPGSKNTVDDLLNLRRSGMAAEIISQARRGKPVIGICGGYQMLGREIHDPHAVEGPTPFVPGLGLLPTVTTLRPGKRTRQVKFRFNGGSEWCEGYEIHSGETKIVDSQNSQLNILSDGQPDGCICGNVYGTYIHGFFDNAAVTKYFLRLAGKSRVAHAEDETSYRQRQYDLLARHLRKHIDIAQLYKIMES